MVGQALPYIPQYQSIKRTKRADAFSPFVSLILIVANSLRVYFWIGQDFPVVLLLQSLVMVSVQMLMVRVCVDTLVKSMQSELDGKSMWDLRHFWNWDDFSNHCNRHPVQFLALFNLSFCFLTAFFSNQHLYFQVLGFFALGIESMLGVPQFLQNYKRHSTEGLSFTMVIGWLIGDCLKSIYFVLRHVPSQFLLCGCLQICVDIAILVQFAVYVSKPRDYLPTC